MGDFCTGNVCTFNIPLFFIVPFELFRLMFLILTVLSVIWVWKFANSLITGSGGS